MTVNTIVTPSSQVESLLPGYINETYTEFVNFMTKADESEERVGFSQNLLQDLNRYRDFNTYRNRIVQKGVLAKNISATDTELELEDGYGFPEEDGVLYIDDEIIYYRQKIDNTFYELERGASGTVILPTYTSKGTYRITTAASHTSESVVTNVSVLFLVSMLETIYETYAPEIIPSRVSSEINNATLLENIRDFFQSKGSKLGIKSLFKILFAENDVDVTYPGDRMIIPSKSTWQEAQILRVLPLPPNLCPATANLLPPDKFINARLDYYTEGYESADTIIASAVCEYAFSYPYESEIQYELTLQKDSLLGNIPPTPATILTRDIDTTDETLTVETTIGFPAKGVLYIGTEGISYTSKSLNQFFGCKRGYLGVYTDHERKDGVFGSEILKGTTLVDGVTYETYCWVLGLAEKANILDGGLLHKKTDEVHVNGPGATDAREPVLASIIENYDEKLVTQAAFPPAMTSVTNITEGVNSVYFNGEFALVSTSGFPSYTIGVFSADDSIGPNLIAQNMTYGIPLQDNIRSNDVSTKGTNQIGVFVDGVAAYSDASPRREVQGSIAFFSVLNEGSGYKNPTVVIDPPLSAANAVVTDGRITDIQIVNTANILDYYTSNPTVRISSGEGATFNLTFDLYGRITGVTIPTGGNYYKDAPVLSVVDSSNRGLGALLTATVSGGSITAVTIVDSGIDYNPATTSIVPFPEGSGAEVTATVQYYQFNRYQEVVNNPGWTFDSGNGFLYQNPAEDKERSTYGYVCSPTQLRNSLEDTGTEHSPILGWALDGNPIYGPYGYENGKDNASGISRMTNSYVLQSNRNSIVPGGEINNIGLVPPTVGTYDPVNKVYPMGTFVEDFVWEDSIGTGSGFVLTTESGDDITTNSGVDISADSNVSTTSHLDKNNGRICNTPDYPKALYPNGVYAYFITVDASNVPAFPYILGENYNNAPVEWYLNWDVTGLLPQKIKFGSTPYTPERNLDIELLRRYRNSYLSDSKKFIDVDISTLTTGGVSSILVESGLPANSMVGDLLYYDNDEQLGSGALGIVSYVEGEDISDAKGSLLIAYLISHRQRLDLSGNSDSFTFVKDTLIRTWNDALARVESYDSTSKLLIVQTDTLQLVTANPTANQPSFYDNLYRPVQLFTDNPPNALLGNVPLGSATPNDVIVSYFRPTVGIGGADVKPGDLWWSIYDGRLFIYYQDNDSSQWVVTQPLGTTPYGNLSSNVSLASDEALVTADPNPPDTTLVAGGNNTITIATIAPSQRADGTPNKMGDLWWSQETGILFVWYTDGIVTYTDTGTYNETVNNSYWVISDPAGIVPLGDGNTSYADNRIYPADTTAVSFSSSIFTNEISAMIADDAPTQQPDGSALEFGNLFWSRKSGKLYVYWSDGDSTQWTVCNPSGSITGQFALDNQPNGPVGPGPGPTPSPVGQIDELSTQQILWFDNLTNFIPGDNVIFETGAPGVADLTENAIMKAKGPDDRDYGIFIRGYNDNPLDLPNGMPMTNQTRALYTVTTAVPHNLETGDEVIMSGSSFPEVNGRHNVLQAGTVIPAVVTPQILDGKLVSISLISGGALYRDDFIISFTGGGGQSAFARANVSPLANGGTVESVTILNPGFNYSSVPTPILGTELPNTVFVLSVSDFYGTDNNNVTYTATGKKVSNKVSQVALASSGTGYSEIPPALGLYKKQSDRAVTTVTLSGTSVGSVTVKSGGARYVSPSVVFSDKLGSGSGATGVATVSNGVVTKVEITTGGTGYSQPILELVEESGKYISLTDDIGKITSLKVIDSGKKVMTDSSMVPELQIITRCIVSSPTGEFVTGSHVYQGTKDVRQVTGMVVSYDDKIQQLTLEKVNGVLRANEMIYGDGGASGMVKLEGEADCRIVINGTAEPVGRFINDTSMLDTKYAHIQDSYYYQWFSYSIQSPLQKVQYETLVNDIIHPSGFIMFSELDVNNSINIPVEAEEVVLTTLTIS